MSLSDSVRLRTIEILLKENDVLAADRLLLLEELRRVLGRLETMPDFVWLDETIEQVRSTIEYVEG